MKTKIILRLAVLFFIVINIRCSKDSISEDTPINIFKAKVSGNLINFGGAGVIEFGEDLGNGFYVAKCKDNKMIELSFPKTVGTYSVSDGGTTLSYNVGSCNYLDNFDKEYDAIDGTLTLTVSNGTKIKGTFQFTGESYGGDLRVITEGVFEIQY